MQFATISTGTICTRASVLKCIILHAPIAMALEKPIPEELLFAHPGTGSRYVGQTKKQKKIIQYFVAMNKYGLNNISRHATFIYIQYLIKPYLQLADK